MDFHEKIQTNPITGLPDAVKALIISKLDRSSRLSLFQVSRVTRDLVFSHCTGIRYTCHTDCHEHELLFTSVARRASPVHLTLCENGGLGKLVRMAVTMGVQLHAVHSLKVWAPCSVHVFQVCACMACVSCVPQAGPVLAAML